MKNSPGATTTPLSPWIGSTSTAATSLDIMHFRDSASPYSKYLYASEIRGSKPFWYTVCPVAPSAAEVRPWKPSSAESILPRPVCLTAIFIAASLASAPLLTNSVLSIPPGVIDAILSASSACSSTWYRFETCANFSAWLFTADTQSGCE